MSSLSYWLVFWCLIIGWVFWFSYSICWVSGLLILSMGFSYIMSIFCILWIEFLLWNRWIYVFWTSMIMSLILSTMVYGWRSRSSMCCTEVGKQGFRNRRGWMGNRDYENDLNLWFEVGCENMELGLCTYYCGGLRGQLYPRETCGILYGIVWWHTVPVLIMANRDSYFEPRLWENW